ncbi:MAG: phosphopantetheine-binding protein [Actinomycetota bacterium]|nr:acyl carrier protein [Acidimicrobiia bacterium]MDQ3294267.1 phosphopantetheine-binding protein [Actinomycetota bacterium]
MPTLDDLRDRLDRRRELSGQLKQLVVDRLDLPVDPDWITDDQALFGRGLELDSVDALELVVGLEFEFNVSVTDDDVAIFGSIGRLADHVEDELG